LETASAAHHQPGDLIGPYRLNGLIGSAVMWIRPKSSSISWPV
jgi:hypothetical protein